VVSVDLPTPPSAPLRGGDFSESILVARIKTLSYTGHRTIGQVGDYEALIRELLTKGDEHYFADRDEEAVPYFQKVLEINPDNYEVWHKLGVALGNLGRYEEAIDSYDQAIKIKPDYDETWNNRGVALFNSGRYEEAIASYDRAVKIKPDKHETWYNRGVALGCLDRDKKEAIASFDRAVEIKPDDHQSLYLRSLALYELGQYEEAITSYDRAIEIEPDKYEAWSNRGIALRALGRYADAIDSYDRAVEIKPDDDAAWFNRGISLDDLGRYEEAITSYDEAIKIKPDKHEAWHSRGVALYGLDKYPEAIDSYDRAIEINPDDHKYRYNRGIAIGLRDRSYQAEIDAYREAFQHIHADIHPEGWGFLQHKIGLAYYDEGNNQLLKYRRNNPQIYYGQALTSYHNALTTLTRAQFPTLRLETLIDTAKAYLAQNNPSVARDCQIEANDILGDLLNAEPTFAGKKRLQIEYVSLSQLDVDLFVASGDNIRALETAERNRPPAKVKESSYNRYKFS
jgi:tetratricopeptide (TPR) repeat protein